VAELVPELQDTEAPAWPAGGDEEARRWLSLCAEGGFTPCQTLLARWLDADVPGRDPSRAVAWLERAVTGGDATAHALLAREYLDGEVVQPSRERTLELAFRGSELGSGEAASLLAELIADSEPLRAIRVLIAQPGWVSRAGLAALARAATGLSTDELHQATKLAIRRGMEGHYRRAYEILSVLAQRDHGPAQDALGQLLGLGLGAPADTDQAARWLARARHNEALTPAGRELLMGLEKALRKPERAALARRAEAWRAPRTLGAPSFLEPVVDWEAQGAGTPPKRIDPASRPIYPSQALTARTGGRVAIRATIGVDGRVLDAFVLRCSPAGKGFEHSALEAVRQWRYEPATVAGQPVAVAFHVSVEYTVGGS
jgi:TonB family protein